MKLLRAFVCQSLLHFGAGVAALLLLLAPTAFAWKPTTHVYLAYKAVEEAMSGRITIHEVNFATGAKTGTSWQFDTDPELLAAIRAYPEKFYAGVLGPDSYPDIATGQALIHAPGGEKDVVDVNLHGPGSNVWLEHIWRAAQSPPHNALQNKAFAAGFLTHAAGDMYAHSYVNYYSGGLFNLQDFQNWNQLKHNVLEGYLGERTPAIPSWIYNNVRNFGIAYPVDKFITDVVNPWEVAGEAGDNKKFSIPYIFSATRHSLREQVRVFDLALADYDRRFNLKMGEADRKGLAANACRWDDFSCSATLLRIDELMLRLAALGISFEKIGFIAIHGIPAAYKRNWIADIDHGLAEWPRVSHRVAMWIQFQESGGARWGEAKQELEQFLPTVIKMLGAPDFLGDLVAAIQSVDVQVPILTQIKQNIFAFLIKAATGMTKEELEQKLLKPQNFIDPLFQNNAAPLTLAELNTRDLKITDPAYTKPSEKWSHETFAPAWNTVLMTKLLLMKPSEVDRLLVTLGSSQSLGGPQTGPNKRNAMLGFNQTLDGSNQWVSGMVFARECHVYQKIFMKQTQPSRFHPTSNPYEPNDPCATAVARPQSPSGTASPPSGTAGVSAKPAPLQLAPAQVSLAAGKTSLLVAVEPVKFLPPQGRQKGGAGSLKSVDDRRALYRAPLAIAGAQQVVIEARAPDGRSARTVIHLLPDLRVVPHHDWKLLAAGAALMLPLAVLRPVNLGIVGIAPIRPKLTEIKLPAPSRVPLTKGLPRAPVQPLTVQMSSLSPGGKQRFRVIPETPVTWSVARGIGRIGNPSESGALQAAVHAYNARIAQYEARHQLAGAQAFACHFSLVCPPGAEAEAFRIRGEWAAYVAANRDAVRAKEVALEAIASTYYAPANVPSSQVITIRATATDGSGRFATAELRLEGSLLPIRMREPKVKLPAGGKHRFEVTPRVAVKWSIVNPAPGDRLGKPGSAAHLLFQKRLAPVTGLQEKMARAKTEQDGSVYWARIASHVQQNRAALVREAKAVTAEDSTYYAPATVSAARTVLIRATADDGRTATAEVQLVPAAPVRGGLPVKAGAEDLVCRRNCEARIGQCLRTAQRRGAAAMAECKRSAEGCARACGPTRAPAGGKKVAAPRRRLGQR